MSRRYIRRTEVEALTGLSRSTIYRMMDAGDFPKPVKLTRKAVGWPEDQVAEWLASRPVAA
ncbi:AlpA family transcriptional regulator [Paracoccus sp. MBLB3053]|uniref:AlpA family transcriptional regulator n=1 Tax=Paracoccus aurantius TaxID=3073814 RepID=A0ABU2HUI6_9RHOB|nr:AlpA family transcriptional regulator [Paracoccus sp. MBLB3053]MDS9467929.1 AlpA family transcriptional regulator [Paracoccus sp. MBLB3053]